MIDSLEADSLAPWAGRRLGAYRLTGIIARGGMGQVYLAERADGTYEQQVAVKLMHEGLHRDSELLRFKAERQILASLDHPNLAKVLDGGITEDGAPYFVMERVEGLPIDAHCRAQGLSIEQRLRLFRSVCQVVHYVHQRGVVHRDLKPANILVTQGGVVKLVDFGIAKQLSHEPRTATAQRTMTLSHASPEQVRGEAVTPASDIYSLGVVLYRLLTDASPYPADAGDHALAQAICERDPPLPSRQAARARRKPLRGDLDAVVMKALRKAPDQRYASAEQLGDDVFRHLEDLPVQARRGAWSYRAGRLVLRHRAAVGAALLVNLALLAGLGLAAWQRHEAHRQKELAESHFASARKLANMFIFDLQKALERVPGALQARKTMVDTALAYLQRLSAETGGDQALQLELVTGYRSIGDMQGGGTSSSLGDSQGAMASYDRAVALLQPLLAPGPLQRAAQAESVTLAARKGALLMALGRWKEAEAQGLAARSAALALMAAEPADYAYQRLLGSGYRLLASVYQRSANAAAFDTTYEQAVRHFEKLRELRPDDLDTVSDLGAIHAVRAVHLQQNIGTPEARLRAFDTYRKSLDVMRPAYEKNPLHLTLASYYGKTHGYAGLLLTMIGRPHESLEYHRRAVEISTALASRDPGDARARAEQAEAHGRLAVALRQVGDRVGSVDHATQSLGFLESLPELTRGEVVVEFNRAVARLELGISLEALAARHTEPARRRADLALACVHHREAQRLLEGNLKRRPANRMTEETSTAVRQAVSRCAKVRPAG